jgi:predicted O-methyltransferase YrrM
MAAYRARTFVPALVAQAQALASAQGFTRSCTMEVGRLLHMLAAHVGEGRIGEIGTGTGVGTAWMASGLAGRGSLVTIELDAERATAARTLFADVPNVRVLHGDALELLEYGPFDLLFADAPTGLPGGVGASAHGGEAAALDRLLGAVKVGGLIVKDDLTPEAAWPEAWRGQPDLTRELWLNDPRFAATELIVDPAAGLQSAVIVATYLGDR